MNKETLISIGILCAIFSLFIVFDREPKPINDFKFEKFVGNLVVEEDPNLPTLGRHQEVGGVHFIKLKKYPICLLHETRHAIEGDWHKDVKSDEDCYVHE